MIFAVSIVHKIETTKNGKKALLYLIIVMEIGTVYPTKIKNDTDKKKQYKLTLLICAFLRKNNKRRSKIKYTSVSNEKRML